MHCFISPLNPLCPKFLLGADVISQVQVPARGIPEACQKCLLHYAKLSTGLVPVLIWYYFNDCFFLFWYYFFMHVLSGYLCICFLNVSFIL